MEIRDLAIRILSAETIEDKLFFPDELTDLVPGPSIVWKEPIRPSAMGFKKRSKEEKLPPFHELGHPDKRAACLHRFAGHELLAVEIMAFALLAFPSAPIHFRKGLANTLKEEQGHVQLYLKHMSRLGVCFGDLPLYRHFWTHTPYITSPLHYVSMMSLTFEMANLDFAPIYGKCFLNHGDPESSELMATICHDEMSHVQFGWHWMKKLKDPLLSDWDAWKAVLETTLLTPKRAKGFYLHEDTRRHAGISEDWIQNLKNA